LHVTVYHKGWRDSGLYADAVNMDNHEDHDEAMVVFRQGFKSYETGDVMYVAFEYETDGPDPINICEDAFREFNIGDGDLAHQYRQLGNRSLSVGDVLVIDGAAFGVASSGWDVINNFNPTLSEH
jgi:hypothetical protein